MTSRRVAVALVLAASALREPTFAQTQAVPKSSSSRAPHEDVREDPQILIDRARWFLSGRRGPDGFIPWNARNRALAELEVNLRTGLLRSEPSRVAVDTWAAIGPMPLLDGSIAYSGRITAIAIPSGSPNTAYVGAAQGGVWKTTDLGASWAPLTDTQASLAVGSIAIDPTNASILYIGTGEANQSCDSYFGAGILKSVDAGSSWTLIGQSAFQNTSVSKIVVSPVAPLTLWAASSAGTGGFLCYGKSATLGVWKSIDGGGSWSLALGSGQIGFNANITDLVIDPLNANVLYAGVDGSGVWKTTDGGSSWSKLAGGLPTASVGRVDLAIKPGQSSILYGAFENSSNSRFLGAWKSVNAGSSWSGLPSPSGTCQSWAFDDLCTYSGGVAAQCWYDLVIEAAADGSVFMGGTALFRSPDEGATWLDICPSTVHVDQHAIAAEGGGVVWLGNDGGVFRTTTNGTAWSNLNARLAITQFYPGASLHPTNPDRALGGTQDNGTLLYSGAASWREVFGGDGAFTAIDFTIPNNIFYASYQYLHIVKTTNGGSGFFDAITGLADADTSSAPFIAPYAMCPANPAVLVAGSNNAWRTSDGAGSWASNSPDPLDPTNGKIRSIAFAPSDPGCNVYFAGLEFGKVYRTVSGGSAWTNITGVLPTRGVNDVAVDPTNPDIVYVALSGFGGSHLYKTTNALAPAPSWVVADIGIPDTPINAVLVDPDTTSTIYIGTDIGIFRSMDAGGSWAPFMTGHPRVAVYDLVADSSTNTIISFTHGRSAFRSPACGTPAFSGIESATDSNPDALGGIRVRWTAPSTWGTDAATGTYAVTRYTTSDCSGSSVTVASNLPASTTTILDTTVVPGVGYTYRVTATNDCAFPRSTSGSVSCSEIVADFADSSPSSASYRLERATTNTGGNPVSSASYVLTGSLGQESTIGVSASPSFVAQSGFWSYAGSGLTPVALGVGLTGGTDVMLSWSGNDPPYTVYRSTSCADVYQHPLTVVGGNSYTDTSTPAAPLVCYAILASAPGP